MVNQTHSRQGQAQEFWTLVYGLWTSFDNVLLEHGELPCCILTLAVYLALGHFPVPDTQLGSFNFMTCKPCFLFPSLPHI